MFKYNIETGWLVDGDKLYFASNTYNYDIKRTFMIMYHPFMLDNKAKESNEGKNSTVVVYRSHHNKDEEILVVNDKIVAIRVSNELAMRNLIFGIKNEYKYIVNNIIIAGKSRLSFKDKNISTVVPTNIVVSLNKLEQLDGLGEWFVNTKLDGTTAVLAYINYLNTIVAYELSQKGLDNNSVELIAPKIINSDISNDSVVFMGEYLNDNIYLFLECNDNYHDYRIDYEHMKLFVDKCNIIGVKEVQMNTIVISTRNESYKDITKKILKIEHKGNTDGLVFGRISDKFQLKWKPISHNSIDLRIIYVGQDIYLYAAENKYLAIKRIKNDKKFRGVNKNMLMRGSGKYIDLLWDYRKNIGVDSEHRNLYHNKICECNYVDGFWSPMRIRSDKTSPNHYGVAENILYTIKHPITLDMLIK
jgi:hypothetical protein